MSDRTMLEPTPELPDDTLISGVEFPARIRTVLAIAGLETVGEVRETSDEILLSFQDFGKASASARDARPAVDRWGETSAQKARLIC
jgi:DNA-directed RNA polymerase alpha subunit